MGQNNQLKSDIFEKIILLIFGIMSLILIGFIKYVDILPNKTVILICFFVFLFNFVVDYAVLELKIKKRTKKIIASFLIFVCALFLIASSYIFKTLDLFNNMNIDYKTHNYSVVVLKEKYDNLEQLTNKKIGYYSLDTDGEKSLEELNHITPKFISYNSIDELGYALLIGDVDAIILEDSYKDLLNNKNGDVVSEDIVKFSILTKTIYQFSIDIDSESIAKKVNVKKEPFNIYISGIDTYGNISSVSRSDVNIVVTVNPNTHKILLTSIPRDYYVHLSGTTGYNDKLTHAGIYGIDTSVKTIEELLDISINYYVKVNFSSIVNIVNALKGVDVYSEYSFVSTSGYAYNKGYNYVKGDAALAFVRERKAFSDGDRQRGKNQQAMIEAILKKCISPSIIINYDGLLNSLNGSFTTNMSSEEIRSFIKTQLDSNASWTISNANLDGSNGSEYTYSYRGRKLYVMIPNQNSIQTAKELINQVYSE